MISAPHKLLLTSIILIQISGFVLLWMKIPEPALPVPAANPVIVPAVPVDPASAMGAMKLPDEQMLRESIQEVLRQELRTYAAAPARGEKTRNSQAGRETALDRPLPEAGPQVMAQANAIVDRAVSAGAWTNNDNSALLQLAGQLSQAQRVQILEKIFGAINRQQMRPVGALPSL
jgi:hypothetical protein